jgi:hypothetical protein
MRLCLAMCFDNRGFSMNEIFNHLNVVIGFSSLIADGIGITNAGAISDAMQSAARKIGRIGWNITDELNKSDPAIDKLQEYLTGVAAAAEQLVASATIPVVHEEVSYLSQRILDRVGLLRACLE